jgi:virulence family protein
MKKHRIVTLALATALLATGTALAASVKSGPQVGDDLAGPSTP